MPAANQSLAPSVFTESVRHAAPETTVPPTPHPRLHLGYIDGLRGLAAIYVVIYHCNYVTTMICGFSTGLVKFAVMPLNYGHQAVDLFIVLSGFCLMLPALRDGYQLRGGFKTFLAKRARRILPPYYVAIVLSLTQVAML